MCCVQEDKSRVDVFGSYSSRNKINLFELLFPLLHDADLFVAHQARSSTALVIISHWRVTLMVLVLVPC